MRAGGASHATMYMILACVKFCSVRKVQICNKHGAAILPLPQISHRIPLGAGKQTVSHVDNEVVVPEDYMLAS